jgi:hypothetical protein
MAGRIAYYGNIVRDGLILDLDAAKRDSYPGTGTVWRDIAGGVITGSLINGPTFDPNNGGSIVFDGTNDYVNLPYNPNYNFTTISSLTWVKTPIQYTGSAFKAIISKQSDIIFDREFNFYTYSSLNNGVINQLHFSTGKLTSYTGFINVPGGSLSLNTWHQIGFTVGNGFLNYVLNGQIIQSTSTTGTFNATGSYDIKVGRADNNWLGNISNVLLYNRILSSTEVLQNYNATKGRFGL